MKNYILTFIIIFFSWKGFSQNSLSGKLTDKITKEPLIGATLYFPDLKKGTTTGKNGDYIISDLPTGRFLLEIRYIGFAAQLIKVNISSDIKMDLELEKSHTELDEIVVTGTSQATERKRTPTPITIIPQITLLQNSSTNIIDVVATQPGISQVTTGTSISKPIIRGLGYNRVVVVNDGIRQEGQQWGDEHGIEVDEFSVNKVEILKGPASLSYGSDALAGVINMISNPTLQEGTIRGNILGNYQSNNGLIGYSANIAGNLKGFTWDLRYSGKQAHSYQNKYDGYVYGSAFEETNIGGIVGINKSWGYSHLHFSAYTLIPGIVEGERDSASGKFIKGFALNDSTVENAIVSEEELKSYTVSIPHQDISHYKAVLNNNFIIKQGTLKAIFGIQQNHRQEFDDVLNPNQYALYFLLNTVNYDVRYLFPEKNDWQTSLGISGMYQISENKGEEFLVPEYNLLDIGGFLTTRKSFEKLNISGGIRYDSKKIDSKELLLDTLGVPTTEDNPFHDHKFEAFNSTFSNISGSIGLTYQFSKNVFTKLNISRGFRAPNIAELGANGEHEGTVRYEIGNPTMKAETSLQFDYALGLDAEHISAEINIFNNIIDNFIYTEKLNSVYGGDSIIVPSEPMPTFKFTQGKANIFGGEAIIDIHPHPLDWLHFENSFAYVLSIQQDATDSTKYLPFTPAPKFSSDLRADIKKIGKVLNNMYIKIGVDNYFEQSKFYSTFGTETATPGYTLINLGAGTDFISKGNIICSLYLSVNNLTDVAYQNHLSRLKYSAHNYVTGRSGVYNMGRNISVKLVLPIRIKASSEI